LRSVVFINRSSIVDLIKCNKDNDNLISIKFYDQINPITINLKFKKLLLSHQIKVSIPLQRECFNIDTLRAANRKKDSEKKFHSEYFTLSTHHLLAYTHAYIQMHAHTVNVAHIDHRLEKR
jgi:hypothetical protein